MAVWVVANMQFSRVLKQIAPLEAEIKNHQADADKAEQGAFKKKVTAFIEADKKGDQAALKKMIGEFAANASNTPTN